MIFNLKYCLMHLMHLLYNRYDKQLLTLYKCNEIKFHYVSQNDLYSLINKDLKYFIFRYTYKYIVYNFIQPILNVSYYKPKTGCIYESKKVKLQQKSI